MSPQLSLLPARAIITGIVGIEEHIVTRLHRLFHTIREKYGFAIAFPDNVNFGITTNLVFEETQRLRGVDSPDKALYTQTP
jgi:hypothetical protein